MGPRAGTARAPLRPRCRRLQRVRAVEGRGRAGHDITGALAYPASPAAGESGQELRRTAVDAQIPRRQCDVGPYSAPPGGAGSRQTAEDETPGPAVSRAGPPPRRHRAGPLNLATRGWVAYFRMADVKASFADVDKWLRRKLRCIMWRQWKRPRTRVRELRRRGLELARARASAFNGRGPWWNAGASHMHAAVPTAALRQLGLLSLLEEHQRRTCAS